MSDDDLILWDVVEEHLDEAEYLAMLWCSARRSPSYTLSELERGPQARLLAHIDGLVINGPLAIDRVVIPVLDDPSAEPMRVTAAALAMLQAADSRVWEAFAPTREAPVEGLAAPIVDEEPARLAALRALALRLDALAADASDLELQQFELGAEAWRSSTRAGMDARIAAETDDARALELQEIDALLAGNAPPGADVAGEAPSGEDDEQEPTTPEDPAVRRRAELASVRAQLDAATDEADRAELQELVTALEADELAVPETTEAPVAAAEPTPEPTPELDPRIEALGLALALANHPQLDDQLRLWVTRGHGVQRLLALRACADRGADPGPGIERALGDSDVLIRAAAVRAVRFGDRSKWLVAVERNLQHADLAVRAAALDTAMMWGSHRGWELAQATYKAPEAAGARVWLACKGTDAHVQALVALLADAALRPDVLWALGFSGSIRAVVAALPYLGDKDERTCRLAGEVIASILGLDPRDETLWELPTRDVPPPESEEPVEDLDADLTPMPEDDLLLPKAEAIRAHVARVQADFAPGKRYLLGRPVERDRIAWALAEISCRRVDVLAREAVARSQGVGRWPGQARASVSARAAAALAQLER